MKEDDLIGVGNTTTYLCSLCKPPVKLDTNAQRILEHVGAHILFDPTINRLDNPCGLCLHVDTKQTTCSNVPIPCPLCPGEPSIWRYNLQSHFVTVHSTEAAAQFRELWDIAEDEMRAMRFVWDGRQPKGPKRTTKKKKGPALIASKAHSSSVALPIPNIRPTALSSGHETDSDASDEERPGSEPMPSEGDNDGDDDGGDDDDDGGANETWEWRLPSVEPPNTDSGGNPESTEADEQCSVGLGGSEKSVDIEGMVVDNEEGPIQTQSADRSPQSTVIGEEVDNAAVRNQDPLDEQDAPTGERARRTRKRRLQLNACWCGEVVDASAGDATVVECKKRGCETRYYHRNCVDAPKNNANWHCDACKPVGARGAKRARG